MTRGFAYLALVPLSALGAFAPSLASASDQRCAVTEVAPGVKMRSQNCPLFYAHPAGHQDAADLPPGMMRSPPEANTFRFGNTEVRIGGRVRGDVNVTRP